MSRLLAQDTIDLTQGLGQYKALVDLKPSAYLRTAANLLFATAGIVSFFFLLWGGIQWVTAGGDKEGTEKARKKVTNALIGLAVTFSAYALLTIIATLFNTPNLLNLQLSPIK